MSDHPITKWIADAKQRDPAAQQALWNHYFERVVRLARTRMFALQRAVYDEEDAALSAMNSVFRGMQLEKFPVLHDRHNLWRLLVLVTKRKLRAQWRRESAGRRIPPPSETIRIEDVIGDEPTADFVVQMMEETERLLKQLDDPLLQRIVVMKLDGFNNDEIAERLQCASRTVQRKTERIRDLWSIPEDD